jgi:hypothetical protein
MENLNPISVRVFEEFIPVVHVTKIAPPKHEVIQDLLKISDMDLKCDWGVTHVMMMAYFDKAGIILNDEVDEVITCFYFNAKKVTYDRACEFLEKNTKSYHAVEDNSGSIEDEERRLDFFRGV